MITIFTYTPIMTQIQQDLQQLEEHIETDLRNVLVKNLEEDMELERAQKIAQAFLDLLPFVDRKDLLEKFASFSDTYPETKGVFVKYASEEEKAQTQATLNKMSEHLKSGNIEEALKAAKGGT